MILHLMIYHAKYLQFDWLEYYTFFDTLYYYSRNTNKHSGARIKTLFIWELENFQIFPLRNNVQVLVQTAKILIINITINCIINF